MPRRLTLAGIMLGSPATPPTAHRRRYHPFGAIRRATALATPSAYVL